MDTIAASEETRREIAQGKERLRRIDALDQARQHLLLAISAMQRSGIPLPKINDASALLSYVQRELVQEGAARGSAE